MSNLIFKKKNNLLNYFAILLIASLIFLVPALENGINDSTVSISFYAGIAIVLIFTRNMWILLFYFLIIALNLYLTYVPCVFIGVSITSVIYLYSIFCMIILLIKHRFFIRVKSGTFAEFLFFVFISMCVYGFNGYVNSTGVLDILWKLSPLYMSLTLVILLKDYKQLQDVFIVSIVVAAIIFTAVAYVELIQGSTFFYHLWTNNGERYRNGIMRVGSTLGDPNSLAMHTVPVIFLVLTKRCKSILGNFFCKVLAIAFIGMVILSFSRMSLVALCVGTIFWLWYNGKSRLQILAFFIVLSTVLVSPIILPQIYNMDLASSGQRMMLVMKAIKIWTENVFFGIGLDNFVKRTYWMTMNEYARQLVEFGIFGFASYVFFYFIFVKQFFEYNKRQKNKGNKAEGAFLLAALIAFAFNSFSMESYFHYIMWILPPLFFVFLDEKFICDNKL